MEIVMQKDNVVKYVDSEDKAMTLAAKGFVRLDGSLKKVLSPTEETEKLKELLFVATKDRENLENRNTELEAQLTEAEKQIRELKLELEGTKEQLEAAVKKNKTTDTK